MPALWPVLIALASTAPEAPADALAGEGRAPLVRFQGNRVLPDEVYLAVLSLPAGTPASPETAATVRARLDVFLHQAGYELAKVSAVVEGDTVLVRVNEGQLEKVVFRGRLTLKTLRFQLALDLPHDVFNRPSLERQLRALARQLGIAAAWFELVPTAPVEHLGPQLEELPTVKGLELVHARQPYELHIFFSEREWDTGLGVDVRTGYVDGLELGVNYQGRDGLLEGDRWRLAASGGAGLRRRVTDDRNYPAFSRTFVEGKWFLPRLVGRLRPFVWLWGDLVARQRRDLGLENYDAATSAASAHLELEPAEGLRLALGGGLEWRRLFGLDAAPGFDLAPGVAESERLRPFAQLGSDLVFDTGAARWDRRHALNVEARHYFANSDPAFGYLAHRYQKVTPFGWHDFWVRSRGKWLWGEVAFHNEQPVGEYLHGLFGEDFVDRVGNLSLELRLSVTRDVVKVSLFHDLAAFGALDRATGTERLVVADAFGPGLHFLIEGMLQLDIYVAFGFRSDHRFATAASAMLQKVF